MPQQKLPDSLEVAVVTGGAGEIGAAIAHRLARAGWMVVVYDLDGTAAAQVSAQICQAGYRSAGQQVDVTVPTEIESAVKTTAERFGAIGALINNAGRIGAVQPLISYPTAAFDDVMRTNVHGVFLGMRAVLPIMLEAGRGAIANVASTSAIRGRPHLAGYVASKHAVLGLTKVAAAEVVGTGVRVNAVLPGPIETQMIRSVRAGVNTATEGRHDDVSRSTPAAYGTVEDVAATVNFLVSAESGHLNGASVVVDGGSTIV